MELNVKVEKNWITRDSWIKFIQELSQKKDILMIPKTFVFQINPASPNNLE